MAEQETPKGEEKTFSEDQVKAMIKDALESELAGLKTKNDELLAEAKKAKADRKEAEEIAAKEAEERAKKSGDIEALEKSWTEKFSARETELLEETTRLRDVISGLTVGNTAKTIAAEMAVKGSEPLLEQLISPRLAMEIVDGQIKTYVKDAAGQRSAATIDDLKKEISANEAFKPLLQGTKASGAGGVGSSGGAAHKKFSEHTGQELVELRRSNPQEYDRLKAAG